MRIDSEFSSKYERKFKKCKCKKRLRYLYVGICAIFITSFSFVYGYIFFVTPYTNSDLSIDIGVLILKDTFVRFIWVLFEIGILLFLLINIVKWIKRTGYISLFKNNNKNRLRDCNEILEVKGFMLKEEFISVHKNVRINSNGSLYITFIRKDNSAINVFLSSKVSKKYYNGQEIRKGFFYDLLISKAEGKIELIENNY